MASKEFENWLKNQTHKPGDKITNLQRLTSKFLPPAGVTTWGEWYERENITPTPKVETKKKKEPAAPKEEESKSSGDIKNNIKRLNVILDKQRESLKSLALDDPEFDQVEAAVRKTESEIKANQTKYKEVIKVETAKKTREDLAAAKEDLKYATAVGDQKEIDAAKQKVTKAREAAVKAKESLPKPVEPGVTPETAKGKETPKTTGTSGKGTSTGSTGTGGKGTKPSTTVSSAAKTEEALAAAGKDFALPETLFKHVPSLNQILKDYVNEGWTTDKLRKAIRDDVWYKKNSTEIKARYVQLYNYQDLVASGQADGSTDYEKQIATLERKLADKARAMGSSAANDPAALRRAAENMYITNVGIDDAMTTDFLAAAIKPIAGMIGGKVTQGYSGDALDNYQKLVKTARDNGFQLSDILPGGVNEQQVLAGIASGKIDINRVQQDARKLAAQGQPTYVRDLLAQGYDLANVFAPYRKVMGTVLEVNPDEIDLNDPLLRTAITDKGDMNLYDFKKALRTDNRWQYTEQAKSDVSTAAYNVLRDFGFQG